jgi:hypothetical protein
MLTEIRLGIVGCVKLPDKQAVLIAVLIFRGVFSNLFNHSVVPATFLYANDTAS